MPAVAREEIGAFAGLRTAGRQSTRAAVFLVGFFRSAPRVFGGLFVRGVGLSDRQDGKVGKFGEEGGRLGGYSCPQGFAWCVPSGQLVSEHLGD